ncbi:MAG: type II secretion system F family protein [Akkermansia sp.]
MACPTQIVEAGKGKIQQTPAAKKGQRRQKQKGGLVAESGQGPDDFHPAHTLIDAGLPLLRADVLAKQEANPNCATIEAWRFRRAAPPSPKPWPGISVFDRLFVNMVKAGELGGVLEIVLNHLAEYQEKAQKLKSKVISAMVYLQPCCSLRWAS